jgi:predicted RNA binding protein YcfA (HicA-like mRNA interferase family)
VAFGKVDKEKLELGHNKTMSKKIRELIQYLVESGFYEIKGKGSHRKYKHALYPGAVTISGKSGEDSKRYQEKQVRQAIEEVKK